MKTVLTVLCFVIAVLVVSPAAIAQTATGILRGHSTKGLATYCIYDAAGTTYIKTIGQGRVCPQTVRISSANGRVVAQPQNRIRPLPSSGLDFHLADGSSELSVVQAVEAGQRRKRQRELFKLRMKLLRQQLHHPQSHLYNASVSGNIKQCYYRAGRKTYMRQVSASASCPSQ